VALANQPSVLLADEPTAQLDSETARGILADLRRLQRDLGLTCVIVTHDRQVTGHVDRVVMIRDGRTSTETRKAPEGGRAEELGMRAGAGRLRVPRGLMEGTGLGGRVRRGGGGGGVLILPADGSADDRVAGEDSTDA